MQTKAESIRLNFLRLQKQNIQLNCNIASASQYNDCLGTRSKACSYRGQPKAGTGHKMLSVPFVFSKSRFQGPAFRCDKTVVIVTLLEAIRRHSRHKIITLGNDKFPNFYERLLHERKLKSGYLERRIYE